MEGPNKESMLKEGRDRGVSNFQGNRVTVIISRVIEGIFSLVYARACMNNVRPCLCLVEQIHEIWLLFVPSRS